MSTEKCKSCGKSSEYPEDWYYDDRSGYVKVICPHCGWQEGTPIKKKKSGWHKDSRRHRIAAKIGHIHKKYASEPDNFQVCPYHGKFKVQEEHDWQCPKCEVEIQQFSKWQRTKDIKDAPLDLLERSGAITSQQKQELSRR